MSRPTATHCKRNHAMTPDNVYHPPADPRRSLCRTCIRDRNMARDRGHCLDHHVTIASLRAELAAARQSIRAQRRVIADLQAEVARRTVTHRRIADGGVGGRRERRELERAA